jgi:hypothetical protein
MTCNASKFVCDKYFNEHVLNDIAEKGILLSKIVHSNKNKKFFFALPGMTAWHSGHRVRLQNRQSQVRNHCSALVKTLISIATVGI